MTQDLQVSVSARGSLFRRTRHRRIPRSRSSSMRSLSTGRPMPSARKTSNRRYCQWIKVASLHSNKTLPKKPPSTRTTQSSLRTLTTMAVSLRKRSAELQSTFKNWRRKMRRFRHASPLREHRYWTSIICSSTKQIRATTWIQSLERPIKIYLRTWVPMATIR